METIIAGIAGGMVVMGLVAWTIRASIRSMEPRDETLDLIEKWRNGK